MYIVISMDEDTKLTVADAVDAEVVEKESEDGLASTPAEGGQATVMMNLEEMIKKYISSLDRLQGEIKLSRQMFEDAFENNPTYRENSEKAKEASKAKLITRKQIASQPGVIQIGVKIKDMRLEIKERQASLSDYLQEYQRMTGATEIEDENGQLRRIVTNAKAIKDSSKK